jgi:uncharacterized protein (UPF0335 family)
VIVVVERVERIDEEIKALNEGKKEVLAEAKGEGFDVKVLREILRLRKQDKDERGEQESLLDLYLSAMESGGSSEAKAAWRQAGDELPVVQGGLLSPRFNQPSMNQSAFDELDDRMTRRAEAIRRASTSVAGPIRCERRWRWLSSGRREPPASCRG